ncbi:phage baseplate plug family protein [Morganella morganii]|uniref:phage baseplate plug family protein n=1 Tax=Morganella morganii TaxID=582 RepID=UPI0031B1A700
MNIIEIPVSNKNQQFDIQLGGKYYRIRLVYRQFCGWTADMMDQTGTEIFTGVPLVSGVDILEPYRYMGFNGSLIFVCDETAGELSFRELGRKNRLYFRAD